MSDRNFMPRGVTMTPAGFSNDFSNDFDKQLAEFVYKTPRFPNGIRASDLRNEPAQVQMETAQVWFWGNLKPYEAEGLYSSVGRGRPLPSNGEPTEPQGRRPHGAAPWDPPAVLPHDAIFQTFGSVLSADAQAALVRNLPGLWMWREDLPAADSPSTVLDRLDALAEEVRQLATSHGQRGHNSGAWYPEEAQREALEVIAETKLAVRANAEDRTPVSEDVKGRFARVVETLGRYSMVVLRNVAKPVLIGAETEAGKLLVHLVVGWFNGQSIAETLKHWH